MKKTAMLLLIFVLTAAAFTGCRRMTTEPTGTTPTSTATHSTVLPTPDIPMPTTPNGTSLPGDNIPDNGNGLGRNGRRPRY